MVVISRSARKTSFHSEIVRYGHTEIVRWVDLQDEFENL